MASTVFGDTFPIPGFQILFRQLAGQVARQLIHEIDDLGQLEAVQPDFLAVRQDLGGIGVLTFLQLDHRRRHLAQVLVRGPHHRHVRHFWMQLDRMLNLVGEQFTPPVMIISFTREVRYRKSSASR